MTVLPLLPLLTSRMLRLGERHHPRWLPAIRERQERMEAQHGAAWHAWTAAGAVAEIGEEVLDVPGWASIADRLSDRDLEPDAAARVRTELAQAVDLAAQAFVHVERARAAALHGSRRPA